MSWIDLGVAADQAWATLDVLAGSAGSSPKGALFITDFMDEFRSLVLS